MTLNTPIEIATTLIHRGIVGTAADSEDWPSRWEIFNEVLSEMFAMLVYFNNFTDGALVKGVLVIVAMLAIFIGMYIIATWLRDKTR